MIIFFMAKAALDVLTRADLIAVLDEPARTRPKGRAVEAMTPA